MKDLAGKVREVLDNGDREVLDKAADRTND